MMGDPDEAARLKAEQDQRFAAMAEAGVEMHAMKKAYVEAGFTDLEALHLVTAVLVASIGGGGD